jgi:hypothetical protein
MGLALAAAVIALILSKRTADKKLISFLESSFGKLPAEEETEFESISKYSYYMDRYSKNELRIDNTTWNDLDMDKVFEQINVCLTSIGEEYLYNCLREPQFDTAGLTAREEFINVLDNNPKARLLIQKYLSKLGKENYSGLSRLIFNPDEKLLGFPLLYDVLSALPLLGALSLLISIPFGITCIVVTFLVNTCLYFGTKMKMDIDLPAIQYFSSAHYYSGKICKIESLKSFPALTLLKEKHDVFQSIAGKVPASANSAQHMSLESGLSEYINILFFRSIRKYNKVMKKIIQCNHELHVFYRALGEIDLSLCILSFRKTLPFYTTPEL